MNTHAETFRLSLKSRKLLSLLVEFFNEHKVGEARRRPWTRVEVLECAIKTYARSEKVETGKND